MKKVIKKTVNETKRYCDICGEPASHQCLCCHRDLCSWMQNKHAVMVDNNSDYPDYYCQSCWDEGKTFREKISDLEEKCDTEVEKLRKEWFEKAKSKLNSQNLTVSKFECVKR